MMMEVELAKAIVNLDRDGAVAAARQLIESGSDPLAVLEQARAGMTSVGERFEEGGYFLSELILSAGIFKGVVRILEPHLAGLRPPKPPGTIVLATMEGDIHDLGKNLFATLLRAHGFRVHDLGVDVAPADLAEKVEGLAPDFVGFSALLTTAFKSMKEAADRLSQTGFRNRIKLLVGGGVTTPAVSRYVGADFQSKDAMRGVAYCLECSKEAAHGA